MSVKIRLYDGNGTEISVEELLAELDKELVENGPEVEQDCYFLETKSDEGLLVVIGPPGHAKLAQTAGFEQKSECKEGPILGGGWATFAARAISGWSEERGDFVERSHRVTFHSGSGTYGTFTLNMMGPQVVQSIANQLGLECYVERLALASPHIANQLGLECYVERIALASPHIANQLGPERYDERIELAFPQRKK